MVKRLESSWAAFKTTVDKILAHHENAFGKVSEYQKNKNDADIDDDQLDQMLLAGSEVNKDFTDNLKVRTDDDKLEQKQKARMLEQMQTTWDDIETSDQGFGFNDLSLGIFRQDLALELQAAKEKYEKMPRAVYSGFKRTIQPV